jgi:oligopeptide/dipeptide ABC transporter ATP-binding protein
VNEPLVDIRGLVKHFPISRGARIWSERETVHAVNGVDLAIQRGEFLALVGESGSGKTTLAGCIAGFVRPTAGAIHFDGKPLVEVQGANGSGRLVQHASQRQIATRIQMVFQDPSSALNPRHRIRDTLAEPLLVHGLMSKADARKRVGELLELTGIRQSMWGRYPHELNSGQRQRVVIARALTVSPILLIADEPVSKLDVSMQGQILNLLLDLHRQLGLTILFITHDLSVVRQVADRVIVMYLGRVMEACSADAFFSSPRHPYSEALVASTPRVRAEPERSMLIKGEIPSPIHPPRGCPFATRCPLVIPACEQAVPPLHEVGPSQLVACIRR